MRRPVIGIVPLVDIQRESYWMLPGYMDGVADAGGLPLMLPLTDDDKQIDQLTALCEGFLFTGGQDVSPSLYGEEEDAACTGNLKTNSAVAVRERCGYALTVVGCPRSGMRTSWPSDRSPRRCMPPCPWPGSGGCPWAGRRRGLSNSFHAQYWRPCIIVDRHILLLYNIPKTTNYGQRLAVWRRSRINT